MESTCGYPFTDVGRTHCKFAQPIIFVLWGKNASRKLEKIADGRKPCFKAAHPASFSAYRGFLNKVLSQINQYLEENGETPID